MQKEISPGTLRLGTNLKVYQKTKSGWKISKDDFPNALQAIKLFKAHNKFKALVDTKNPRFLKGQVFDGKIQGARINILPNGTKLDKAYSIFANHLTFHDQSSHDHWDVIYQNPNGKYAYLYTQNKIKKSVNEKYKKVSLFEKKYSLLERNVSKALLDKDDMYALPMYTLLHTYMRVGNEMYYKQTGHKGLTTLKKKDISIKGNQINFNYIGKDGVPQNITKTFPNEYTKRLKHHLSTLKSSDFVFAKDGSPIKDNLFMQAFEKYCGERFYPHIVRSYYATKEAKNFARKHNKATKEEIKSFFSSVAQALGHKRFDKKNNEWKDSYTVTISHYIQPQLVEKIQSLVK